MKRKLLELLGPQFAYIILCLLRWLFLSSKTGAKIHNVILYRAMLKVLGPNFAEKIGMSTMQLMHEVVTNHNPAILELERKIYLLPLSIRRRVMENTFVWRGIFGPMRRKVWEKQGYVIPRLVFVTPGDESKGNEYLSFDVLNRLIDDLEELGTFNVSLIIEETSFREDLWHLVEKHPRMTFAVYTDGSILDKAVVTRMRKLGNIAPMINLERVSENAVRHLDLCQRGDLPYGVLITVYQDNFQEVVSNAFIKWLIQKGAFYIRYLPYMPSRSDDLALQVSRKQMAAVEETVNSIRRQHPIFVSFGRNGSDLVTSCDAARRQIHIIANGDVKPCLFVPFAIDNIADKGLLEVMESDLFRTIRGINEPGEAKINPCKWHQSALVQTILELTAHPTKE